jgi:glycosyltransferase involved in cell wall biosynthesis
MPKIALFLPDLGGGGAERVCINLAAGFLERGVEVDFVLAKAEGALLEDLPPEAGLIDLAAGRTFSALLPLAGYLRREKPYAVVAAPDHANLVAVWAGMLSGGRTRVVITHHIHPSTSRRNTPKLQEKLYPGLLRLFQRRAASIVAVSNGVADDLACLARIPRRRIEVIYNPVVSAEMEKQASAPCDHPWFAADQPPVILAAGRLTIQKDYPTLLHAYARLRSRREARLVILGEGELRPGLLALAKELGLAADVDLPGFVKPYPYMARCKAFVLASTWEGFGIVLVEAMACGAQVVSTDCPSGPAEILENGKYGRLAPVGDPAALARAIEAALDDPLPAEMLRQRAQAFSVGAAAEKYLDLLDLSGHGD